MQVYVSGIGLLAEGLEGWEQAQAVLRGQQAHEAAPMNKPTAEVLPATERRRSSEAVRLAVTVAAQALAMSGLKAEDVSTVFTSADADSPNTNAICVTLATQPTEVSPTRFHNCVHNAAAGYWTIATHCHAPSLSTTANQASFAVGLLDAVTQVIVEQEPILLVGFDVVMPFPLSDHQATHFPLGLAFLLTPKPCGNPVAVLDVNLAQGTQTASELPVWADAWQPHPMLDGMRLAYGLAQQHTVVLPYQAQQFLEVKVSSCN